MNEREDFATSPTSHVSPLPSGARKPARATTV